MTNDCSGLNTLAYKRARLNLQIAHFIKIILPPPTPPPVAASFPIFHTGTCLLFYHRGTAACSLLLLLLPLRIRRRRRRPAHQHPVPAHASQDSGLSSSLRASDTSMFGIPFTTGNARPAALETSSCLRVSCQDPSVRGSSTEHAGEVATRGRSWEARRRRRQHGAERMCTARMREHTWRDQTSGGTWSEDRRGF